MCCFISLKLSFLICKMSVAKWCIKIANCVLFSLYFYQAPMHICMRIKTNVCAQILTHKYTHVNSKNSRPFVSLWLRAQKRWLQKKKPASGPWTCGVVCAKREGTRDRQSSRQTRGHRFCIPKAIRTWASIPRATLKENSGPERDLSEGKSSLSKDFPPSLACNTTYCPCKCGQNRYWWPP